MLRAVGVFGPVNGLRAPHKNSSCKVQAGDSANVDAGLSKPFFGVTRRPLTGLQSIMYFCMTSLMPSIPDTAVYPGHCINGGTFNANAPFGSYKQSGNGREDGIHGFKQFLEFKLLQLKSAAVCTAATARQARNF